MEAIKQAEEIGNSNSQPFDWHVDADAVVVSHSPGIAVYTNCNGDVVVSSTPVPEMMTINSCSFAEKMPDESPRRSRRRLNERQAQHELDEAEINLLVRDSLEKKYAHHIEAKLNLSPNTARQYVASCKKFHKFCQGEGMSVSDLPAKAGIVASFLHEELTNGASGSTIRRHAAAISYAYRLNEFYDPCEDKLVKAIVFAATRGKEEPDEDSH